MNMLDTSILICKGSIEPWDYTQDMAEQLRGADKVIVHYSFSNHQSIKDFIYQLEEAIKINVLSPLKMEVYYSNEAMGARIKKELKEIEKTIKLSWITKNIVVTQTAIEEKFCQIDGALKEICQNLSKAGQ